MKKSAARNEPVIRQLGGVLDGLSERQAINAGWFNVQVLGMVGAGLLMLRLFLRNPPFYLAVAAVVAALAWRILLVYWMARKVSRLAARLVP